MRKEPEMPTRHQSLRFMNRAAALALGGVLALGLSAAAARAADPPGGAKVERQIGVMEKILDKVLLDSPNFLVSGGENTRGIYLSELGALFTFEAALTNQGFDVKSYLHSLGNRFEVKTDEDGNQVIVIRKGDGKKDKKEKDSAEEAEMMSELKDAEQTLEQGREELIEALLDYGETLTALGDGQSVVIAAFLPDTDLSRERGTSRLLLRAKMGDLRAYSEGRVSEQEMRAKVLIEEN
jgi:hypothetical protein